MMRMTTKNCANCDRKFEIPDYFNSNIFHCPSCIEPKYEESRKKFIKAVIVFMIYESLLFCCLLLILVFLGIENRTLGGLLFRLNLGGMVFGVSILHPLAKFSMYRKEKKRYEEIRETMEYIESGE